MADGTELTTTEIIESDPRYQRVIEILGWEDVGADGRFDLIAEIIDALTGGTRSPAEIEARRSEHMRRLVEGLNAADPQAAAAAAAAGLATRAHELGWVLKRNGG
jgi:hypothetical protein